MQPLAFVDLETTGASATKDRITEIGIILVDGNDVQEWSQLIYPQTRIPLFIEQITGISNSMVENAPTFEQVAKQGRCLITEAAVYRPQCPLRLRFPQKRVQTSP